MLCYTRGAAKHLTVNNGDLSVVSLKLKSLVLTWKQHGFLTTSKVYYSTPSMTLIGLMTRCRFQRCSKLNTTEWLHINFVACPRETENENGVFNFFYLRKISSPITIWTVSPFFVQSRILLLYFCPFTEYIITVLLRWFLSLG